LAGGVLGVLFAAGLLPLLVQLVPNALPVAETPALDVRILLAAIVVTTATGLAFGVWPALRAGSRSADAALREGRTSLGGRRGRARTALVVAEVAACVALLACCGLLLRALRRVETVPPGFRSEGVLTLRTALPQPRYAATVARAQFYERVLSEVRALPGVDA